MKARAGRHGVLLEDLERHDAEGGEVGAGEDDLGGGAGFPGFRFGLVITSSTMVPQG